MQTFLPYPDFDASARVLDRQRLGKQRVENLQIMNVLVGQSAGWSAHPAVKMWRGHEAALLGYQLAICREWSRRGYRDTCLAKTLEALHGAGPCPTPMPPWLGDDRLHASHRSNLIRKLPEHYQPMWPSESGDLEYHWPV